MSPRSVPDTCKEQIGSRLSLDTVEALLGWWSGHCSRREVHFQACGSLCLNKTQNNRRILLKTELPFLAPSQKKRRRYNTARDNKNHALASCREPDRVYRAYKKSLPHFVNFTAPMIYSSAAAGVVGRKREREINDLSPSEATRFQKIEWHNDQAKIRKIVNVN